jgi:hypothetical protein
MEQNELVIPFGIAFKNPPQSKKKEEIYHQYREKVKVGIIPTATSIVNPLSTVTTVSDQNLDQVKNGTLDITSTPFGKQSFQEREKYFTELNNAIERKKVFLAEKRKELAHTQKENSYLRHVGKNYNRYYAYIVEDKKNQMEALSRLNEYIGKLQKTGELSEQNLKDSKKEQKKILRELGNIEKGLDEIMQGVNLTENNEKMIGGNYVADGYEFNNLNYADEDWDTDSDL